EARADVARRRSGRDVLRRRLSLREEPGRDLRARERIDADARVDLRARARRAARALELGFAVRARGEEREHPAGRVARDDDLVVVDAELRGVRARPADRGLHVVNLRGPFALAL